MQVGASILGTGVTWTTVVLSLTGMLLVQGVIKLLTGQKAVSYLPGYRVPFQNLGFPGAAIPTTWWNPGMNGHWLWRFYMYKSFGSEVISSVPFLVGLPSIYVSNLDVYRQVAGGVEGKVPFGKDEASIEFMTRWGQNVFAAEGDTWRRHRRIMAPAFNNDTFNLVWEKVCDIYAEMSKCEGWDDKQVVDIPALDRLTLKLALLIIGSCGFGFPFSWAEPLRTRTSEMSVQEALDVVSSTSLLSIALPRWLWNIPLKPVRRMRLAYETLFSFLVAEAASRKNGVSEEMRLQGGDKASVGRDVFSLLVLSNEAENAKLRLSDQELIGNMYVMLFAGHESTANSLTSTLVFLSLDESAQEELYEHIISVVGTDHRPTYQDYAKLDKVLGAFYEGIRMIPAASIIVREVKEDTTLVVPKLGSTTGETERIAIRKRTQVILDLVGIQYNPRYFPEPEKFKPSRWYGSSNGDEIAKEKEEKEVDNVIAFSVGPRACIGRKFATTEAVAFLTLLLRDWRVEPLMREGETREEWKERVIRPTVTLALAMKDVPLRLRRR